MVRPCYHPATQDRARIRPGRDGARVRVIRAKRGADECSRTNGSPAERNNDRSPAVALDVRAQRRGAYKKTESNRFFKTNWSRLHASSASTRGSESPTPILAFFSNQKTERGLFFYAIPEHRRRDLKNLTRHTILRVEDSRACRVPNSSTCSMNKKFWITFPVGKFQPNRPRRHTGYAFSRFYSFSPRPSPSPLSYKGTYHVYTIAVLE